MRLQESQWREDIGSTSFLRISLAESGSLGIPQGVRIQKISFDERCSEFYFEQFLSKEDSKIIRSVK